MFCSKPPRSFIGEEKVEYTDTLWFHEALGLFSYGEMGVDGSFGNRVAIEFTLSIEKNY